MFGAAVHHPVEGTDLMTYMQWDSETNLMALECLGDLLGLELPDVELPPVRPTRHAATFAHLVGVLGRLRPEDPGVAHEVRLAFRTARHLARADEVGEAVEQADLDDLEGLLGFRPETWLEGDAAFERFVLDDARAGHRHDAEIVRVLHRRQQRIHLQLGPPGSKMVRHLRPQPF
jgi:hypothetical protein